MKGTIRAIIASMAAFVLLSGCYSDIKSLEDEYRYNKYDDQINELDRRVKALEELCDQMNTNIASLQTIVDALQDGDYIKSVTPVMENGKEIGYSITFSKSGTITVYHGKDGQNGTDGNDGIDGNDGHSPVVGVRKDTDGNYYWTLDGEWLTDDSGSRVKANGADGQDGQGGTDGITPELKIENGYWYLRYGSDGAWQQLGKATGEDGKDGQDGQDGGDSIFSKVDTSNGDYVIFTLADGTVVKIPTWKSFEELRIRCDQMNTNIASLQTIVDALQGGDYIKSVTPVMENGKEIGYSITFSKSGTITVYHGKDGQNGTDGNDGIDGNDGHSPVVGVRKDTDGNYYWTLDGEWLTDDSGSRVKANGADGQDGQGGTDGITPELKIENGYWYLRYGSDGAWQQLGKATGEDGKDGQDGQDGGDSIFSKVDTSNGDYVIFTLTDGTVLKLPLSDPNYTQLALNMQDQATTKVHIGIQIPYTIIGANESTFISIDILKVTNNGSGSPLESVMRDGLRISYNPTAVPEGRITFSSATDIPLTAQLRVCVSNGETTVMKLLTVKVEKL